MDIAFERIRRFPDTGPAHQLVQLVGRRQGVSAQSALIERLFQGYFRTQPPDALASHGRGIFRCTHREMTTLAPTPLIVPGLRDHVAQHWQTWLAERLPQAHSLTPMGRENLLLSARLDELEATIARLDAPVLLVAHSGGCVLVAHWARQTARSHRVHGALLATPPTFDRPLPPAYPQLDALDIAGWLPVPRQPLPFPSLVAASRNDVLGEWDAICQLARDWGSALEDLGAVGHLNPASGYGPWPQALALIERLAAEPSRPAHL